MRKKLVVEILISFLLYCFIAHKSTLLYGIFFIFLNICFFELISKMIFLFLKKEEGLINIFVVTLFLLIAYLAFKLTGNEDEIPPVWLVYVFSLLCSSMAVLLYCVFPKRVIRSGADAHDLKE